MTEALSLPTDYQTFIATSRYSRFRDDLGGRREFWPETVDRYCDFIFGKLDPEETILSKELRAEIRESILGLETMPSMRGMMTAGPALERDNTCIYNCSYLAIDDPKAFDEAMFILMCGTGVGFSVERQYVNKLPDVPDRLFESETTIVVKDSKEGWSKADRKSTRLNSSH
jgi:ribonucleoside-diphosphate reductase alpha chain